MEKTLAPPIGSRIKGYLWKLWYQHMAKTYQSQKWKCMNYSFAPLEGPPEMIELDPADAISRYSLQLYHHVVSSVDLTGLEVLEVGSGRGGGADYIKRYLKPKKVVGVDFAKDAVKFCNATYDVQGLSFKVGNAMNLPFEDESFDVVVNVESSHCYPSMESFLAQVNRVLRKGGYFLFADLRYGKEAGLLREQLRQSGLTIVKETDITANVVRGLQMDSAQRTAMIKQTIKKGMIKTFLKFTGTEDSEIFNKFKNREATYMSCVLQKPN